MMLQWNLYLIFSVIITLSQVHAIVVDLPGGKILGREACTTCCGTEYAAFQGIPYAEPPERFQLAKPKQPWSNTLNCTYDKEQCAQGRDPVTGSENCLFLSVYTPDINGRLPVLVWIHGGYFTMGDSSYAITSPDYFVDEGVVFVQLNYRLGVFGFLSTGDLACPGNLGFKDQVLALQWVQENIKYFGGDPTRVTLGGQSSGAVAVSLHLQSPKSKGLFRAVILNSGSSLSLFGLHRRAKETATELGKKFNYYGSNTTQLIEVLKKQTFQDLQTQSSKVSEAVALKNPFAGIFYGYVSEPEHDNAFFSGKSEQLLAAGKFTPVPCLVGFNSKEGAFVGTVGLALRAFLLSKDLIINDLVPADLSDNGGVRFLAALDIKFHFFPGLLTSIQSSNTIATFISADQWVRPTHRFAINVNKYVSAVYAYQFSYEGPLSGLTVRQVSGVGHSEELNYLFNVKTTNVSENDSRTRRRAVRLWSNFVKFLNPTPDQDDLLQNAKWLPFGQSTSPGKYNYFDINSNLTNIDNPYDGDVSYYDRLYTRYGDKDYDTY